MYRKNVVLAIVCCLFSCLYAEEMPVGYYAEIDGKQDTALRTALATILNADSVKEFKYGSGRNKTWHIFYYTDRNEADNSVVDMYSNNVRYFDTTNLFASVKGCDIEHTLPNSWWGGKAGNATAYTDIHLLVPADFSANRSKSNMPPGYVGGKPKFDNGVMRNGIPATVGSIAYPKALSKVFEPSDAYKGDFARMYFYTATRYESTAVAKDIKDAVLALDTASGKFDFLPWLVQVLLEWHRLDPVSNKEMVRNNTVFEWQRNRNPYIDFPELVEYIWGNKKGEKVVLTQLKTSAQVPETANKTASVAENQPFTETKTTAQ